MKALVSGGYCQNIVFYIRDEKMIPVQGERKGMQSE
jgi:hypothetical protein